MGINLIYYYFNNVKFNKNKIFVFQCEEQFEFTSNGMQNHIKGII
jgi:hypothetical protein